MPLPHEPSLRIAGVFHRVDAMQQTIWLHMQRYLAQLRGCVYHTFDTSEVGSARLREWRASGIVMHVQKPKWLDRLRPLGVPIVNTSGIDPDPSIHNVLPDSVAAGRLAGEHLLAKGFDRFAYIGPLASALGRERLEGFEKAVGDADHEVQSFDGNLGHAMHAHARPKPNKRFVRWIKQLPEGTGMLVAGDHIGVAVCEHLRYAGIDPLEKLAIVSAHDRQTPCDPPLSAVRMPEDRWGYEAARLLMRVLRGEVTEPTTMLLDPLGVVERASTSRLPFDDPYLRAAVGFIHDHAAEPIDVADVTTAASLGRRALERRFRAHLNCTILEAIHKAHLEIARSLLIDTDMSTEAVARESGLTDEKQLRRVMVKFEHTTPGAFRKRHRIT